MSTPSTFTLTLQPPPRSLLKTYNILLSASSPSQPPTIPQPLKDALHLRETVFVNEQLAVPLQHHIDADDARSYHWVLYSNPNSTPIGTIRLVPPPQNPHPEPGAKYEAPGKDVPGPDPEVLFDVEGKELEWTASRKTDLHDGVEPFLKLGRLCLLKEYRGRKLADLLIQEALGWARKDENREVLGGGRGWKGLVCVHARVEAVKTWERNGFVVDERMGTWFEAGIRHVGMFGRLEL